MLKRLIIASLAICVTLSFSSCKEEKPGDITQTSVTELDEIYESALSDERYDGYNFRMLVRQTKLNTQCPAEQTNELVEDANYARNKAVEERFGIRITATESSNSNYETDALTSILAGDDAYDLVFAHTGAAFSYAVQGASYDINEIEAIDIDKPWWSQDLKSACSVNDHLYVLDGDISPEGFGHAMCLYFNKNIFDELGIDYPYDMVLEGEWTFDEFEELVKQGVKDVNGDGVITPDADRYGFTTSEWSAPINILYAGGQRVYSKNEDGEIELSLYSSKTADLFDDFFSLLDDEASFLAISEGENKSLVKPSFTAGNVMFVAAGLTDARWMRSMEDDFGILPYPKYEYEDNYTTTVNAGAPLALIPVTVTDPERTGAIVEALGAYGAKGVIPAFYDITLKTKFSRDNESEEMLDIIKDSIIYDLGYMSGNALAYVGRDLALAESHDFASYYAGKESTALWNLKEFNTAYAKLG